MPELPKLSDKDSEPKVKMDVKLKRGNTQIISEYHGWEHR